MKGATCAFFRCASTHAPSGVPAYGLRRVVDETVPLVEKTKRMRPARPLGILQSVSLGASASSSARAAPESKDLGRAVPRTRVTGGGATETGTLAEEETATGATTEAMAVGSSAFAVIRAGSSVRRVRAFRAHPARVKMPSAPTAMLARKTSRFARRGRGASMSALTSVAGSRASSRGGRSVTVRESGSGSRFESTPGDETRIDTLASTSDGGLAEGAGAKGEGGSSVTSASLFARPGEGVVERCPCHHGSRTNDALIADTSQPLSLSDQRHPRWPTRGHADTALERVSNGTLGPAALRQLRPRLNGGTINGCAWREELVENRRR